MASPGRRMNRHSLCSAALATAFAAACSDTSSTHGAQPGSQEDAAGAAVTAAWTGTWQDPTLIDLGGATGIVRGLDLAVSPDGSARLVVDTSSGHTTRVLAVRRTATANWSVGELLQQAIEGGYWPSLVERPARSGSRNRKGPRGILLGGSGSCRLGGRRRM